VSDLGPGLPVRVDLRERLKSLGIGPRRQGARGTCSVFAVTLALEWALAGRRGRGEALSQEFLNWASNRAVDDDADGGFFHDLWKGYEEYGISSEALCPYEPVYSATFEPHPAAIAHAAAGHEPGVQLCWIKAWDVETGLTVAELASIRASLASGRLVCAGLRWPREPVWTDDVLQWAPPQRVFDGHSIVLAGYHDEAQQPGGGCFIALDSGAQFPGGMLPYAYAAAYTNDACWIG
jgi:hypothetical protein